MMPVRTRRIRANGAGIGNVYEAEESGDSEGLFTITARYTQECSECKSMVARNLLAKGSRGSEDYPQSEDVRGLGNSGMNRRG